MSHPIPRPPKILIIFCGLVGILCILGGFAFSRNWIPDVTKSPSGQNLEVLVQDGAGACELQEEYEPQGYSITIHRVNQELKLTQGFIVAEIMEPAVAKVTAHTLTQIYQLPVILKEMSKDQTLVEIGPIYKTESEAKKISDKLESFGYHWHVMPNLINKNKHMVQVFIKDIPPDKISTIKNECLKKAVSVKLL